MILGLVSTKQVWMGSRVSYSEQGPILSWPFSLCRISSSRVCDKDVMSCYRQSRTLASTRHGAMSFLTSLFLAYFLGFAIIKYFLSLSSLLIRSKYPLLLLLFSPSVVSSSLQPHGLQHTKLACPSPSPRTCSYSCPLSQ